MNGLPWPAPSRSLCRATRLLDRSERAVDWDRDDSDEEYTVANGVSRSRISGDVRLKRNASGRSASVPLLLLRPSLRRRLALLVAVSPQHVGNRVVRLVARVLEGL